MFVNVQTRGQPIEIDPATDRIVARIDLPGGGGNHGLWIDSQRQLAFVAREGNDTLIVLDLKTHALRGTFALGNGRACWPRMPPAAWFSWRASLVS